LFDIEGKADGELTVPAGAELRILSWSEEANTWWKGMYNGEIGFVPSGFVALLLAESDASDSDEDDDELYENNSSSDEEIPPKKASWRHSLRGLSRTSSLRLIGKSRPLSTYR